MSQPPRPPRTPPPPPPGTPAPVTRGRGSSDVPTDSPSTSEMTTLIPPPSSWSQVGGLVGQVFGDFELLEELGRGGMGVVYKAIQRSLDRHVALKLLLPEYASNPTMLMRFLAEARAAASLTHPNIISIYQVGECMAGPYFVMEFIDGPSLEQFLTRTRPIPWVVALMATVAEAVQHAHDKGIVHRDLKPGNVMLHQQKRPVVMDFGIAKIVRPGGTGHQTSPGALLGTPAYMPPEQAGDEPSKIGPHSDIYSLGAILYTLLSGQPPFDEGTALKTLLRVVSGGLPPSIRSLRPEVPAKLERIAMRCMEKEPGNRYPSAHALAEALKRFRATLQAKPPSGAAIRVAPPVVVLIAEGGKQKRLTATTVIGRASECDLVIHSREVSKRHCRILLGQESAVIEDLGSVNGTLVNDEPIEPRKRVKLSDGDRLDIAGHTFTVRLS
jgi:serine/threonine protein kinase